MKDFLQVTSEDGSFRAWPADLIGQVMVSTGETSTVYFRGGGSEQLPTEAVADFLEVPAPEAPKPPEPEPGPEPGPDAPTLTQLNPATAPAGSPDVHLHVRGVNYTTESKLTWDGEEKATTFASNTELVAIIPIPTAGAFPVTVRNGDQESAPLNFQVT